jgi:hypothetical protein
MQQGWALFYRKLSRPCLVLAVVEVALDGRQLQPRQVVVLQEHSARQVGDGLVLISPT